MEGDNVFKFPGVEDIDYASPLGDDLDVDTVVEGLKGQNFGDILVIGTKDNDEGIESMYFATTNADPKQILWDLERAKYLLLAASLEN